MFGELIPGVVAVLAGAALLLFHKWSVAAVIKFWGKDASIHGWTEGRTSFNAWLGGIALIIWGALWIIYKLTGWRP